MTVTLIDAEQRRRAQPGYREDPSPEQIRQLCEEIQKDWTSRERRRRAGLRHGRVETPVCRTPEAF